MLTRSVISAQVAAVLLTGVCLGSSGGTGSIESVAGVVGLTPVLEHTCLAAFVPLGEGQALSGVTWYNNDGTLAFPRILLAAGDANGPGVLGESMTAATGVVGVSSGLSEIAFDEPITSQAGGVYVIFEFPANREKTGLGAGGGPGIGYRTGEPGSLAWLSDSGQEWVCMRPDYRLAVEAVLVDAQSGMATLSRSPEVPVSETREPSTVLLAAQPNPFNPATRLQFSLREAGSVQVSIYNVRGELVIRLTNESYAAGTHELKWRGVGARGQTCPSGVYFAQFKADGVVMTERLTLVR